MHRRANRETSTYSASFLDVLSNTIGGLAFLLILAIIMIGGLVFAPPVITTEQLPDAYHNSEYNIWLGAREGMGKFEWRLENGILPPGLMFDGFSGKLSGKPLLPEGGESPTIYKFEIICEATAEAEEGTPREDSKTYELKVFQKQPGTIQPLKVTTAQPLPEAFQGQPYPLTFAAEGGLPPYRWKFLEPVPNGLALSTRGRIEGTPGETGIFPITVCVTSASGETCKETFNLNVAVKYPQPDPIPPLRLLTSHLPDSIARTKYILFPSAEGGVPPYRWVIESGKPSWLSVRSNILEGTPGLGDISENKLVLSVLDARGEKISSAPMTLNVMPPPGEEPPPLSLKTVSMPDSIIGHKYEVALAVGGGYPPYEWSLSGDFQKTGLLFNQAEGIFSGIPEKHGKFKAAVVVRDRFKNEASGNYAFQIVPDIQDLSIQTRSIPAGRVKETFSMAFSASGGYPPYSWSIDSGNVPNGLVFTPDGMLTGEPEAAGDWQFKLKVKDAATQTVLSSLYKMRVYTAEGYQKFEVLTQSIPIFLVGQNVDFVPACQGGAPPYSIVGLGRIPEGLKIEANKLTGKPGKKGEFELNLKIDDSSGESESVRYSLKVRRVMDAWIGLVLSCLLFLFVLLTIILFTLWKRYSNRTGAIEIKTKSIPNGRASMEYGVYLACEGGVGPYKWSVVEGELPPGLVLSDDGYISGVPLEGIGVNKTEEFAFTVEVTDAVGNKDRQPL